MSTLTASIVPGDLRIASVEKKDMKQCMHVFLRLLLFPDERTHFFNYSETPHEISVVAATDVIQELEPVAKVDASTWVCIQILEGEQSAGDMTVVQRVSSAVALAEIPVFYVSTFSTDYVLVQKQRIWQVIRLFQEEFQAFIENLAELGEPDEAAAVDADAPQHKLSELPYHSYPLSVPPLHATVTRFSSQADITNNAVTLVRLFFYPELSPQQSSQQQGEGVDGTWAPRLLSLTRTEDEISLILPVNADEVDLSQKLQTEAVMPCETYRIVQVAQEPIPLEETGIVASHVTVLARQQVPVFYLSTFKTDFVMVPHALADTALAALREHFEVSVDELFVLQ